MEIQTKPEMASPLQSWAAYTAYSYYVVAANVHGQTSNPSDTISVKTTGDANRLRQF